MELNKIKELHQKLNADMTIILRNFEQEAGVKLDEVKYYTSGTDKETKFFYSTIRIS